MTAAAGSGGGLEDIVAEAGGTEAGGTEAGAGAAAGADARAREGAGGRDAGPGGTDAGAGAGADGRARALAASIGVGARDGRSESPTDGASPSSGMRLRARKKPVAVKPTAPTMDVNQSAESASILPVPVFP